MPTLDCPSCRIKLQLAEQNLGQPVRCPKCQQVFEAKAPTALGAPPREDSAREQVMAGEPSAGWSRPPPVNPDHFSPAPPRWRDPHADNNEPAYAYRQPLLRSLPGIGLARTVTIVMAVNLFVVVIISLILSYVYLGQLQELRPGMPVPLQVERTEDLRMVVGLFSFAIQVTLIVVFCMWIYRAHDNLELLGVEGRQYTSGWAVGYFFVPILNLYRPLQVMQEIWKASDPQVPPGSQEWRNNPNSALAGFWWAFWLISSIANNISIRVALSAAPSLDDLRMEARVEIFADATALVAGLLLILIIQRIMSRQVRMLGQEATE